MFAGELYYQKGKPKNFHLFRYQVTASITVWGHLKSRLTRTFKFAQ